MEEKLEQKIPTQLEMIESPDEVIDQLLNLFNLIENQITRADTKAGLIVAADTVLAVGASVWTGSTILNLFDNSVSLNTRAEAFFLVLTFVALFFSTIYALVVARPVMRAHEAGGTLFFFGRISQMSYEEFVAKFSAQTAEEFRQSLFTEVYTTARLARKKFLRIRYSLDFLIASVFLFGMVLIIMALSK